MPAKGRPMTAALFIEKRSVGVHLAVTVD